MINSTEPRNWLEAGRLALAAALAAVAITGMVWAVGWKGEPSGPSEAVGVNAQALSIDDPEADATAADKPVDVEGILKEIKAQAPKVLAPVSEEDAHGDTVALGPSRSGASPGAR